MNEALTNGESAAWLSTSKLEPWHGFSRRRLVASRPMAQARRTVVDAGTK
jgi:hypothetical protein